MTEKPAIQFQIPPSLKFKQIINILSNSLYEMAFRFSEDGFRIFEFDEARLINFDLTIPKSDFSEYEYNSKDPIIIPVISNELNEVLKIYPEDKPINLSITDDRKIIFDYKNKVHISTILKEVINHELSIITKFKANFTVKMVSSSSFSEIIEQISHIDELIHISTNGNDLFLEIENNYIKRMYLIPLTFKEIIKSFEIEKDTRSSYSTNFLRLMLRFNFLSNPEMYFGNMEPLKVDYNFEKNSKLAIILAPLVEKE